MERRAQRRRHEGRCITFILRAFAEVQQHRGNSLGRLGTALRGALEKDRYQPAGGDQRPAPSNIAANTGGPVQAADPWTVGHDPWSRRSPTVVQVGLTFRSAVEVAAKTERKETKKRSAPEVTISLEPLMDPLPLMLNRLCHHRRQKHPSFHQSFKVARES